MSHRPFEHSMYPHYASEGAAPGNAPGSLAEHLAEDTVGENPHDPEDLDGTDLADELDGRPTPPFRTPHPATSRPDVVTRRERFRWITRFRQGGSEGDRTAFWCW